MTGTATAECPSCGVDVAQGDRFCEACGHDVTPRLDADAPSPATVDGCLACGEELGLPANVYCGVCGMRQRAAGDRREAVAGGVAGVTDRGRRRARNEDAFAVSTTPGGRVVAVVCDGVSTTTSPDEASGGAAEAAITALGQAADELSPPDAMARAFAAARDAVGALAWTPRGGIGPPSCTFLAALAVGSTVELASMGDCRAFWIPDGSGSSGPLSGVGDPQSLTRDDSWAAEQVVAGTMTSAAAQADVRAHSITRWLGSDADPSWAPRRVSFTAERPGWLVLCSDGLWNYAEGAAEVAAVAGEGEPLAIARRLVDYANSRGGRDNITVVVIGIPGHPGGSGPSTERTAP